jgi:hypothetical protein
MESMWAALMALYVSVSPVRAVDARAASEQWAKTFSGSKDQSMSTHLKQARRQQRGSRFQRESVWPWRNHRWHAGSVRPFFLSICFHKNPRITFFFCSQPLR